MTTSLVIDDAILIESLRCLIPHLHPEWGDRNPFDVFCRLIAKHRKPSGWTTNSHLELTACKITSRQEKWTTDGLGKLARGHQSTNGQDFDCPVILVEHRDSVLVLDGNHRINRWVSTGDTRIHRVNIHTIAAEEKYVDLPAVSDV
jgi:hypothetical protein